MDNSINIAASSNTGRASRSRVTACQRGGRGGTHVPEPLWQVKRSRAEKCDICPGAKVRQTSRTFTKFCNMTEWALRDSNPRPAECKWELIRCRMSVMVDFVDIY